MELGQSSQENPLQKMSFATSGGASSHVSAGSSEDDPNIHFIAACGRTGYHWTCVPNFSHSYVEYLAESSTYLPKTKSEDMIGSNYLPDGIINEVNGVNETNRNLSYNHLGNAFGFKTTDSSTEVDVRKMGCWRPDEGEACQEAIQFESTQHHPLYAESRASWTAESTGDKHNVSRLDPMALVGAPGFLPKPGCSSVKQKTYATDRQRRQRIADNLKALHELLPNPAEGSQAYVLDDIIDYVKYLQLQIKELSGTRFQTESTAIPFIFREGYGHYTDQQVLNEPLEEMMGKLLEEHPAAANQLLESKGLFLLPITLVEDLGLAMQMFSGDALV